jgi:hypothetical protein
MALEDNVSFVYALIVIAIICIVILLLRSPQPGSSAFAYASENMIGNPPANYVAYINGTPGTKNPITGVNYVPTPQKPGVGYYGDAVAYGIAANAVGGGYADALKAIAGVPAASSATYATALQNAIRDQSTLLQGLFNLMDEFSTGAIAAANLAGDSSISLWTQRLYEHLLSIVTAYNGLYAAKLVTDPVSTLIT